MTIIITLAVIALLTWGYILMDSEEIPEDYEN